MPLFVLMLAGMFLGTAWAEDPVYFADPKLKQAVESLQKAIRLSPSLGVAHFNLGVALQQQGKPDAARKEFAIACKLGIQQGCDR